MGIRHGECMAGGLPAVGVATAVIIPGGMLTASYSASVGAIRLLCTTRGRLQPSTCSRCRARSRCGAARTCALFLLPSHAQHTHQPSRI